MSQPHIHNKASMAAKTWKTVLAFSPVLGASLLLYHALAAKQIAAVLTAVVLAECLGRIFRGKKITLQDGQTVLAGCLLAALLPPALPLWISFSAGFFAILLYREFFGGIGQNPFQGILAAYIFLQISFPLMMNHYLIPLSLEEGVRPLWQWLENQQALFGVTDILMGKFPGGLGTSCAGALLLSGAILIWLRLIFWETAFLFLIAIASVSSLWNVPLSLSLLTGNALLTAFFLIQGTGAAAHSRRGMQIFALFAGAAAAIIRHTTVYFDGCILAVLMMSAFSPWLDRLLRPHGRDSVLRNI